jgi:hypothetical protein
MEKYSSNSLFKGTQAWNNFEFFLPKSNPYMPFVNFRKKFRFCSFDFRQNFDVRTFPRWLSIRGTKFCLMSYPNNFFFKVFTLVLLDRFLDGFWKFRLFIVKICILIWYFWVFFENYSVQYAEHTRKRFYRMLSIRGTDFIAYWAYEESISALVQPAVKCEQFLHVQSMLSIRGTNFIAHWAYVERISCAEKFKSRISRQNRIRFSKISCYWPLGPYGFGFCKKSKKSFMLVYL